MSKQISSQATKVWQLLSAQDTLATYRQTLGLTGQILKEIASLLWLVLCLGLVAFDWLWNNSSTAWKNIQSWFSNFDTNNTEKMASEMGQAITSFGKNTLSYTLSQARDQLGLPQKETVPSNHTPATSGSVSSPAPTVSKSAEVPIAAPVTPVVPSKPVKEEE
jgi:hypothetical protein